MQLRLLAFISLLWAVADTQAGEVIPIRLTAPEFSPYSFNSDGIISGSAVLLAKDVFEELSIPIDLTLSPNYGRAVWKTKAGIVDGFFPASQNDQRDAIAQFSTPLLINRWSWFSIQARQFNRNDKQTMRVGSLLSTNTHRWLDDAGYQQIRPQVNVSGLVSALQRGELDGVLLSEEVFLHHLQLMGVSSKEFVTQVQVEQPFGIYISHSFLEGHPNFMERLNVVIEQKKALVNER